MLVTLGLLLLTVPEPGAPRLEDARSSDEVLAQAQTLYDAQEYDSVVPLVEPLPKRPGIRVEQLVKAYVLLGSSMAILGRTAEAEIAFRTLVRSDPEFDFPDETSPRILGVFRRIRAEERAVVEQTRRLQRKRIVEAIRLQGSPPTSGRGGQPVAFEYQLTDASKLVAEVSVRYRRPLTRAYSSLALVRSETGAWRGSIPGAWTSDPNDYDMEYFVVAADAEGETLVSDGSDVRPNRVPIKAGMIDVPGPIYQSTWFWVVGAAAIVAGGVTGYVLYQQGTALPESDFGPTRLP